MSSIIRIDLILHFFSTLPSVAVMLEALLLLFFSSPVVMVPPLSAPVACKRCCDPLGPAEGSGDQRAMPEFSHIPEVRTFINMTILKGKKAPKAVGPELQLSVYRWRI